jgi:hypothetical protein
VWSVEYTHVRGEFTEDESEIDEVRLPYNIYGAVVSWQAWRQILELQAYVNYIKDAGAGSTDYGAFVYDLSGATYTQIGLTAKYTPSEQQMVSLSILREKIEARVETDSYGVAEKYTGDIAYSYKF